jgi:hypothetical protein
MNDPRPDLLHDALNVLDRYSAPLGNRDPVKSLNEDQNGLLRRVRAALAPLVFNGKVRRKEVADLVERIDEVLATGCSDAQSIGQSADARGTKHAA